MAVATTTNDNSEVTQRANRLSSKLKDYARRLKAETDAKTTAEKQLAELAARLEGDPLRAENDSLKAQIRTDRHKLAFEARAREAGLNPAAIEDAWNLSGYKADTETVDPARIDTVLNEQRVKRPYLFGETTTPVVDAPNPGPAKGRGGDAKTPAVFQVTKAQLRDPKWKVANKVQYDAALKDKTIQFVD